MADRLGASEAEALRERRAQPVWPPQEQQDALPAARPVELVSLARLPRAQPVLPVLVQEA